MIMIVKESKARNIFKAYSEIAAFSLGTGSKGYEDAENGINISYKKAGFLPSNDTINGVVEGDLKGNKIIKKVKKSIMTDVGNPKKGDFNRVAMGIGIVLNMIKDNTDVPENKSKKQMKKWEKSHAPNIIVFVLPDADDAKTKKRNKFLVNYIVELFSLFGLYVLHTKKDIKNANKNLFKIKGKGKKKIEKSIQRNAVRVRRFIETNADNGMAMDEAGEELFQAIRLFYSTEYIYLSMDNSKELIDLKRGRAKELCDHLISCFTGRINVIYLRDVVPGKLWKKEWGPAMAKKNKMQVAWYEECSEILSRLGDEFTLPKVKFGNTKKSKKKWSKSGKGKDLEAKMKTKKFIKFFTDSDNRPLLRLVYAHIVSRTFGLEIGSSEYNRNMTNSINVDLPADFSKAFISAAKAYAKEQKAEAKTESDKA